MNLLHNHRRKLIALAAAIVLAPLLWAGPFLIPDLPWDSSPRNVGGVTVFDAHTPPHPGHFSFAEKLGIATKVNVPALFVGKRARRIGREWATFEERTPIGAPAPAFDLMTTDGARVSLASFAGRHVALMFVAITCPPARLETPRWEALQDKYDVDDVKVLLVYSREQHPGEPGYRSYRHPRSMAEKTAYAEEMAGLTALDVVVDPMSEDTLQRYGVVPNAGFVINRAGRIVFKSTWADAKKVEKVLDTLLAMEAQGSGA